MDKKSENTILELLPWSYTPEAQVCIQKKKKREREREREILYYTCFYV
jgi:hypothetical protein